ncbi:uncharacterized protein [Typha latifolia]|uniref:uncharacterized protein isoform X2 n=1 Tax=Typha latifolia TaxID=4733 RepID=UPI003C2B8D43
MDFDEYEYLEKAVENPEPMKGKGSANGVASEEKKPSRSSRKRSDEAGRDTEHQLKRSRSEDGSGRDRDRHRERGKERERDRDKSSREHKEREERNGKEREREVDRDANRERERERERDRDKGRKNQLERHQEVERERYNDRSKEREFKERDFRERDRGPRRPKDRKEDGTELEADPERDQRTVFAFQICLKADERDVYEFFSRAGKVRDVRLITDRNSRRSKGFGYVEFYDSMSVPMAIALSGQLLLGQPVMVKPSEAEKNLAQSTTTAGAGGSTGTGGARKLYVGNLHLNITEVQLRQVFESFGIVELVQLPLDPQTGLCKGFGFVQFARLEDAVAAQSINGQLDIAGRTIKVSAVTDQVGMQDAGGNAGDLDDDEGGGLSLNARSRALLMQKLDRSGTSIAGAIVTHAASDAGTAPTASLFGHPAVANPVVQPTLPALVGFPGLTHPVTPAAQPVLEAIGIPSECLLLKNMFDPSAETEPAFELDIEEDVQEECSKFGIVKHIYVDKNSAGHVYLRFDSINSATNAQQALHGRWFAGKMITATYMLPQNYEAKFPDSS